MILRVFLIVAAALSMRFVLRNGLIVEHAAPAPTAIAVWPGTIVFGFYFAVFFLSVRSLAQRPPLWRLLGILSLAVLAGDLVFINIYEVSRELSSWYGGVVLWDFASFFFFWKAHDALAPSNDTTSRVQTASLLIPVVAMKLGRELLVLGSFTGFRSSVIDLYFGDVGLLVAWLLAARQRHTEASHAAAAALVSAVVLYWSLIVSQNLVMIALHPLAEGYFEDGGFAPLVNAIYAFIGILVGLGLFFRRRHCPVA